MLDIYNYILETNHVSRIYSVAAVLYLQSVLHAILLLLLLLLGCFIFIFTFTRLR
jgi:hypothetical protein